MTPAGAGRALIAVAAIALVPILPGAERAAATAQVAATPPGIQYDRISNWQRAAVVALSRQLPTDSGYWALGPIDPLVQELDTLRLIRTSLRILVPDDREARRVQGRLWVPTGGVALERMQTGDTLPHEPPPGYPGRFLHGTLVGQTVYVQVLTIQQHRWLLWADRVLFEEMDEELAGPVARYSEAIADHLAGDGGNAPPRAADYELDPAFDFLPELDDPVIRDREGYLRLLEENREFSLGNVVRGVYGVMPGPELTDWLSDRAARVLVENRSGAAAAQRMYRDYAEAGGGWTGMPILNAGTLPDLEPGVYAYAIDRYGLIRVGRLAPGSDSAAPRITPALLVHNDPVRAAGRLRIEADPEGAPRVAGFDIRSEEYLFSNLSLSIYEDIEQRSDDFLVATAGHVLQALAEAGVSDEDEVVLITKF